MGQLNTTMVVYTRVSLLEEKFKASEYSSLLMAMCTKAKSGMAGLTVRGI